MFAYKLKVVMGLPWEHFQILIFCVVVARSFPFLPLLRQYALLLYVLTHTLPGFLLSKQQQFSFIPFRALYLKCSSAQLHVGTNTSSFFILFCYELCMVDFCILHPQCCLENRRKSSKMFPWTAQTSCWWEFGMSNHPKGDGCNGAVQSLKDTLS